MIGKGLRKITQPLLLIFYILKKKKYFQLIFQNTTELVKNKLIVLMIPNEEKEGWHYLAVKILSALFHKKHRIMRVILIV